MSQLIDMVGQKINRLTILERDYEKQNSVKKKSAYWKCKCDCGKIITVRGDHLRNQKIQSCGCLKKDKLINDLTNKHFGKLTAIEPTNKRNRSGHVIWVCRCDCGNGCEVASSYLINNHVSSCGCTNSIGEAKIQKILQENLIQFEKEKSFEDLIYDSERHLRYDFYLPLYNRLIEFDGKQHYEESPLFKKKISLQEQQKRDSIKNQYAKSHGIDLIRIPYWERDNITLELLLSNKYLT